MRSRYPLVVKHADDIQEALGSRLRTARMMKKLSLQQVADKLKQYDIDISRGTIGAWEDGRNVPDALVVRRLSQIYAQSAEALLWEDAVSMEAMQFAAQFDGLKPGQQDRLRSIWMAFIAEALPDDGVEARMPITKGGAARDAGGRIQEAVTQNQPEPDPLADRRAQQQAKDADKAGLKKTTVQKRSERAKVSKR